MTSQTLTFRVKKLSILTDTGFEIDISAAYSELNLFDGMFTPCISGNVLLADAENWYEKYKGFQYFKINVHVEKIDTDSRVLTFNRQFSVYKSTNVTDLNLTSKSYILHFVNEDYLQSERLKVDQAYEGKYSDIVKTILVDKLNVSPRASTNAKSGIDIFHETDSNQKFVAPMQSPYDVIEILMKKSVSARNSSADYLFYETSRGYCFASIKQLFQSSFKTALNFNPKNVGCSGDANEFLGVRSFKIIDEFNYADGISSGAFGGTMVAFDPLIREYHERTVQETLGFRVNNPLAGPDNRIVTYMFESARPNSTYIRENYPEHANVIDNTPDYIFQRMAVFSTLMQRRIRLVLPGNFGLKSGDLVTLNIPKYAGHVFGDDVKDISLSGDYIILAARHVISFTQHETIIEVAANMFK